MVDQAKVSSNGKVHEPRVREHVAGFAHDLAALAELQMKLLAVDLQEGKRHATVGFPWLAAAAVVALGSMPVLLLAAASALTELGLAQSIAQVIVGFVAISIAAGMALIGVRHIRKATTTFQRSQRELNETISWIKDSLKPLSARTHQADECMN